MSVPVYTLQQDDNLEIPFFEVGVAAGEPSYVSQYFESTVNLNRELVKNPKATFCVRVNGQSMIGAGIDTGDLLIVDKEKEPQNKQIVLAVINGEYTVKRLLINGSGTYLQPENSNFKPIRITEFMDFRIWGVVTGLIKKLD